MAVDWSALSDALFSGEIATVTSGTYSDGTSSAVIAMVKGQEQKVQTEDGEVAHIHQMARWSIRRADLSPDGTNVSEPQRGHTITTDGTVWDVYPDASMDGEGVFWNIASVRRES